MASTGPRRAPIVQALGRSLRQRCPHCGRCPVFDDRYNTLPRCTACGLVYERDPGATWAFTIIADRIPIGAAVLVIFFGAGRTSTWFGALLLALLAVVVVVTSPMRWSLAIGLHYLSRVYWPDPEDPLP
jgi:uncharacterized protein (DUF983 family)